MFRRVVRAASGPALGNLGVMFRRVVRAASGPALGNLGVVFRRDVRAASGPALGNLGVVFRRVVRATEDCAKATTERTDIINVVRLKQDAPGGHKALPYET